MPSTVQQDGSGEADEEEEINAIVDEIERVDRNAREDEANLAQEEDDWMRRQMMKSTKSNLFQHHGTVKILDILERTSCMTQYGSMRQFKVLKSSLTICTVVCETEGCNFRVHGHVPKYESY
uniref:Transposase MuDR plant domain-containing protein n=1 Tax=Oryza meridionalis TaxID=40149 RepID=A0A0E0DYA3_9ORYZ